MRSRRAVAQKLGTGWAVYLDLNGTAAHALRHIMHTPLHTRTHVHVATPVSRGKIACCNIVQHSGVCCQFVRHMLPVATLYVRYVGLAHQRLDRSQCTVGALDRCMVERLGVANPIQRALLRERQRRKRTRARLLRAQLPLRSDHVRVRARIGGQECTHACVVFLCVCACACACVWSTERCVRLSVCARGVCVCVCVCVCVMCVCARCVLGGVASRSVTFSRSSFSVLISLSSSADLPSQANLRPIRALAPARALGALWSSLPTLSTVSVPTHANYPVMRCAADECMHQSVRAQRTHALP